MPNCASCGAEYSASDTFCGKCGVPIAPSAPPVVETVSQSVSDDFDKVSPAKVVVLALLSVLTVSINELPLVPVGFLFALLVVGNTGSSRFSWRSIGFNWVAALFCLAGFAVGELLVQVSFDMGVSGGAFGFGVVVQLFPIHVWAAALA